MKLTVEIILCVLLVLNGILRVVEYKVTKGKKKKLKEIFIERFNANVLKSPYVREDSPFLTYEAIIDNLNNARDFLVDHHPGGKESIFYKFHTSIIDAFLETIKEMN